jgi:hypothetical protein
VDSALLALVSALGGAIIGSLGTVLTVYLQLRSQDRRERIRQAAALASEDRKLLLDIAREEKRRLALPPMSLFISHYLETLKVMERKGLSRAAMKKLIDKHDELTEYAFELEAERRKKLEAERERAPDGA